MKTMKYLSMLLMMVALSVCMVSCGDDDDPVEQIEEETGIIGTWIHTDNGGSMTYRFNKNGTGSRTLVLVENGNSMTKTENFKYTQSENDGAGTIRANIDSAIFTWTYTLTGDVLMLRDDLGTGYWVLSRQ
ncbi:hypothetical protein [Bacteroides intestinalis]|jgi:uncharacterized lipoprotein YehR (DUF1307 family)|uniref:DUF5640 domain-containing protein n=2 Tax=Bacteroides intestinalis TaxID=329854 RepID=A0A6N2W8Y1_9BACE|nr:hypothetical protein [Bacteroides intestinalis]